MEQGEGIPSNEVENNQMENPQATPISNSGKSEIKEDEFWPLSGKPYFSVVLSHTQVNGLLVITFLYLNFYEFNVRETWLLDMVHLMITCHILNLFILFDSMHKNPMVNVMLEIFGHMHHDFFFPLKEFDEYFHTKGI